MKQVLSISFILASTLVAHAQEPLPQVTSGTLERVENFPSEHVTARNIDIWLPESYSDAKKYAVLYMHDGQMLYDAATTWNKQAWDVDDVASRLFASNDLQEFIVVGIWNGGPTRHPDYFPQQPFESLSGEEKATVTGQLEEASINTGEVFSPQSDNYLKFLVEEVKPYVDGKYSVYTDQGYTFVMGSSMGGLISMYAICEYPKVFGGAACLSTHWVGTFTLENNPVPEAFQQYLKDHLPNPENHKLYFDCGDETLDALYPEIQKRVDAIMGEKGFEESQWMTQYFPGENHSEDAWKKRLHIPIQFLLEK
ncbi:MAG TPA: esterase [Cytophagales bacterium]|nr:esterase [Cytophagales bacterium]HAA20603.1 esterase [Cytophagales bacterium]HAP63350.1 esterase [Cytophagales bacterium]